MIWIHAYVNMIEIKAILPTNCASVCTGIFWNQQYINNLFLLIYYSITQAN
jgi:hypothetical protein